MLFHEGIADLVMDRLHLVVGQGLRLVPVTQAEGLTGLVLTQLVTLESVDQRHGFQQRLTCLTDRLHQI